MPGTLRRTREWRVTLATKWAYLDHLTAPEIVDKFEDEYGIEITRRTVANYLDEREAEEVEEQISEKHANTRLQIADREERKHQRARKAEATATKDVPIQRVFPVVETVDRGMVDPETEVFHTRDWRFYSDDDDWPEWATPGHDVLIEFTGDHRRLEAGDRYPVCGIDGEPKYTSEFVGLETVPDEKTRSFSRQEQSAHLEAKGEILGLYEETVNLQADVETSMDDEQQTELLDAIADLQE